MKTACRSGSVDDLELVGAEGAICGRGVVSLGSRLVSWGPALGCNKEVPMSAVDGFAASTTDELLVGGTGADAG